MCPLLPSVSPHASRTVAFTLTEPSLWQMCLYRNILPEAGAEQGGQKPGGVSLFKSHLGGMMEPGGRFAWMRMRSPPKHGSWCCSKAISRPGHVSWAWSVCDAVGGRTAPSCTRLWHPHPLGRDQLAPGVPCSFLPSSSRGLDGATEPCGTFWMEREGMKSASTFF